MNGQHSSVEHRVSIADLTRLRIPLARALGEAGIGGARIQELLTGALGAECPGCRIQVSSDELGFASPGSENGVPGNPKLERLRRGYCARNGCDSHFYVLKAAPVQGLDWSTVLTRMEALLRAPPEPEEIVQPSESEALLPRPALRDYWAALDRRQRAVVAGALSVILLTLCVHLYRTGVWIPGLSPKPRTFIVAPGPFDPETSLTAPASTNTSRPNTP